MPLMSRSTMLVRAFPNGFAEYRPPVCGITIGERLMYFANPTSCTSTSFSSYFSKSLSGYDGRFRGFFASFFGLGSAGAPSEGVAASTDSATRGCADGGTSASVAAGSELSGVSGGSGFSTGLPHRLLLAPADEFVEEVDRAVPHSEGGDLTPVLDELDLHALAQRGVRLLRLDGDLLEDDALPLRSALEGVGLLLK